MARQRHSSRPPADHRVTARLLAVLAAAVLAMLGSTLPAYAHNELRSTSPQSGQTVATAPTSIVLTFNEPGIAMGTQLAVRGPSGLVNSGPPRLIDNTVSQDLQPGAPAGAYQVDWRVTSADGHPINGSFTFTATQAAPGRAPTAEPSTGPAPTDSSPMPGSLKLVIGAVAIIFAVTVARRARRDGANRT